MKNVLVILFSVLLVAGMFVSCEADIQSKLTVLVKFDAELSLNKSLSSSAQYASKEDLDWYYKAVPEVSGVSSGGVIEWTKLEDGLDSTVEIYVGVWNFELKGVSRTDSELVPVYYGSVEDVVFNSDSGEEVNIVTVTVGPYPEGTGTVVFKSDLSILLENGSEAVVKPNFAKIDNGTAFALSGSEDVVKVVDVGKHDITIWYESTEDPFSAEETISITVHNTATVTLSGVINSTGYYVSDHDSLAKALNVASEGSTITLTNDIYLQELLYIDKSITLDGSGNKITSGRSNIFTIDGVDEYIDVVFEDITIIGDREYFGYPDGSLLLLGAVNLYLGDDVTLVADGYGCTLEASVNDAMDKPANVTIDGAKLILISASMQGAVLGAGNGAVINVEDGTIDGSDSLFAAAVYSTGGTVNIKGGTVNGILYTWEPDEDATSIISCSGGVYSEDFSEYAIPGYSSAFNEEERYYELKKGIWNEIALRIAINANLENIVIDTNFPVSEMIVFGRGSEKDITIDLNGKSLTGADGVDAVFKVYEDGSLTIGGGAIDAHGAVIFNRGGTVEILDGTYTQRGTAISDPYTYRYAIKTYIGTTVIQGGTFISANGVIDAGGEEGGKGEVIINGGTFSKPDLAATRHLSYVSGLASLTINDGVFNAVINSSAGGNCVLLNDVIEGTSVTINGGKFSCVYSSGAQCPFYSGSPLVDVEITGGLFSNNIGMGNLLTENTDESTKAEYPYMVNTSV